MKLPSKKLLLETVKHSQLAVSLSHSALELRPKPKVGIKVLTAATKRKKLFNNMKLVQFGLPHHSHATKTKNIRKNFLGSHMVQLWSFCSCCLFYLCHMNPW